jgi:hypothetical protein
VCGHRRGAATAASPLKASFRRGLDVPVEVKHALSAQIRGQADHRDPRQRVVAARRDDAVPEIDLVVPGNIANGRPEAIRLVIEGVHRLRIISRAPRRGRYMVLRITVIPSAPLAFFPKA